MAEPYDTEQQRLDFVLAKIKEAQTRNANEQQAAKQRHADVDSGWQDVRFKTNTYSGLFETAMSVRQQQQMLAQRESEMHSTQEQGKTLDRLAKRPYFARIDVQDAGSDEVESIYIGLASFADRPDNYLVYDWRAPISSIYYDDNVGAVTYQTPAGPQDAMYHLNGSFS